jgi:hypothetical protein
MHVKGSIFWDELFEQHESWKEAQVPALLRELLQLGPQQSESMAAYRLRVEQLAGRLESVGCPQSTQSVIHDMLSGLERQRPAWARVLQGMRGAMPRNQTLALVRRGLMDNDPRQPELLGPHVTHAGQPAAFATSAAPPASVAEQLAELQRQLASQQLAQSGAAGP